MWAAGYSPAMRDVLICPGKYCDIITVRCRCDKTPLITRNLDYLIAKYIPGALLLRWSFFGRGTMHPRLSAGGISVPLILLFMLFTLSMHVYAQECECGARILPEEIEKALLNEMIMQSAKSSLDDTAFIDIPISYHIIRRSNGLGGVSQSDLSISTDGANVLLAQNRIRIYQYTRDYIDSDQFFVGICTDDDWDSLLTIKTIEGAVNIYVLPEESEYEYCGFATFPHSSVQGIVLHGDCAGTNYNNSTLVHELGHYFYLYHPHEDAFGVECPDGSNCVDAGDLLCDTPADPKLSYNTVNLMCEYYGDEVSQYPCNADTYDPQTDNIMSYSRKTCRDYLTNSQISKFRTTLLTLRPELNYSIPTVVSSPGEVELNPVAAGESVGGVAQIISQSAVPFDILSATTIHGIVDLTTSLPIRVEEDDSTAIEISFDAGDITAPCDFGPQYDTIIVHTTNPNVPELRIPVEVSIVFSDPTSEYASFGPVCLRLTVPNTPGFSGDASTGLIAEERDNILNDGSLVVSLVDGADTVVYMDYLTTNRFTPVDSYVTSSDTLGRTVQSLKFVTDDNRIHGRVAYRMGDNVLGLDGCRSIEINYTLSNPCDTDLTVAAGLLCDFNIEMGFANSAFVEDEMIIVADLTSGEDQAVGLAGLTDCTAQLSYKALHRLAFYDFFSGELLPGKVHRTLLASSSTEMLSGTDVAALLSFGEVTIASGSSIELHGAILYSGNGYDNLIDARTIAEQLVESSIEDADSDCVNDAVDNCLEVFNPDQKDVNENGVGDICDHMCGDANFDLIVNIGDPVFLVNYIFKGGPAPVLPLLGNVNCDLATNIGDVVYLINYIFKAGASPCAACP